MIIFPAIDIRGGRCVRLVQGDYSRENQYGDPVAAAERWAAAGAQYLHVVDLDGAREGHSKNLPVVKEIVARVGLPVQLGGGIRSMQALESVLEAGVARAVLGSAALRDPRFFTEALDRFRERIAAAVDVRNGLVASDGWAKTSTQPALDFVRQLEGLGVQAIIYTDISRDGMLAGPNLEALRRVQETAAVNVIAAGGVSSIEDLQALKSLGLYGAIVGKALYTGALDLGKAIKEVE